MPVPGKDVEAYCLLCECKYEERSTNTIKVWLIGLFLDLPAFQTSSTIMEEELKRKCRVLQVTIIIFLSVVGALLLYMLFLLLVDPLIRKPDPMAQTLHNEEDSEVTARFYILSCFKLNGLMCVCSSFPLAYSQEMHPRPSSGAPRGNTVLERVEGAQQRWKKQVQEQRKTVFDRHKMLS